MFRDTESFIQQGLRLPAEDRLRVAERLFESVPENKLSNEWLEEIESEKLLGMPA